MILPLSPGRDDGDETARASSPKGEMADSQFREVMEASLRTIDSILSATEAGSRRIEHAKSTQADPTASPNEANPYLSRALGEIALKSFETIRSECDVLAAATNRAVTVSGGRPLPHTPPPREAPRRTAAVNAPPIPRAGLQTRVAEDGSDSGGIRPLLRAISAHRLIVILTTLAALAGAAAYLAVRQPTYEATANVLVQPVPQDDPTYLSLGVVRDSGDAIRTTQTAATLLDSTEAADRTAQELGGDLTAKEVQDSVDVAPVGETSIIAITGQAADAGESARLADTFTDASLAVRNELLAEEVDQALEQTNQQIKDVRPDTAAGDALLQTQQQLQSIKQSGDPTLELQQAATIPETPSNPGPLTVIPLALIAGLVLGSGAALLREFFDRRIVDAEDAAALYPMPVLARVPMLSAKSLEPPEGTAWYIPPEVREAFQTLVIQLEQRDRPAGAIMVTSPTRGDGKTTSAINLAVTLASAGRSVVLLDFDLRNPQVGRSLSMTEAITPAELTEPNQDLEGMLVATELPTLSILPLKVDVEAESGGDIDALSLRRLIREARMLADCVVVDTPPLGEVSDALTISPEIDDILVVLRPGNTTRAHLQRMGDLLERTGHPPEGCVLIDASERADAGYHSSGYGVRRMPQIMPRSEPSAASSTKGASPSGQPQS